MPQFMPLLAASEHLYGTLTAQRKDGMSYAWANCKGKTGIGKSKVKLARARESKASGVGGAGFAFNSLQSRRISGRHLFGGGEGEHACGARSLAAS